MTTTTEATTLDVELLNIIRGAIRDHPRSQQTRIGMSEVGHPCDRWLSHKLADTPAVNDRGAPWLPTIGTAVHTWLEDTLDTHNVHRITNGVDTERRFLLEQKVNAGSLAGGDLTGSTDVFDRITGTVVDWKIVGKTKLDSVRRHGPGPQYRVQVHVNGLGWVRRGHAVHEVGVFFLPRNQELSAAVWWHEPYDEQVALDAIARAEAIHAATTALGPAAHAVMKTADSNCTYCPWYRNGATDLTRECAGDPASNVQRPDPLHQLIA